MIVFSANSMLLFQVVDLLETLEKHNKEKVILIANQDTEFFFRDNPCIKEIFIIPNKFSWFTAVKLYQFIKKHASYFTSNKANKITVDIYPTLYSTIIKRALRSVKYFKDDSNHYLELHKDNSYLSFYDQISALLLSVNIKMIDRIYQQQSKNNLVDFPWLYGDSSKYHITDNEDYFCILPNVGEFFNRQVMPKSALGGIGIKKLAISVVQIYMDTGLQPIFLGNFNDQDQLKEYQDIILDYCPMADIYFDVINDKQIINVAKRAKFIIGNVNNLTMFLGGMGCNLTVVCESNLMTSIYRPHGSNIKIIISENIREIPTTTLLNNISYLKSLEFEHEMNASTYQELKAEINPEDDDDDDNDDNGDDED